MALVIGVLPEYGASEARKNIVLGAAFGAIELIVLQTQAHINDTLGPAIRVRNNGDSPGEFRISIFDRTYPVWPLKAESYPATIPAGGTFDFIFNNGTGEGEGPTFLHTPFNNGDGSYNIELHRNTGPWWAPNWDQIDDSEIHIIITLVSVATEIAGIETRDQAGNAISRIAKGAGFRVTGTLRRTDNKVGIAAHTVSIDHRDVSGIPGAWAADGTDITDANGYADMSLVAPNPGTASYTYEYRIRFLGSIGAAPSEVRMLVRSLGAELIFNLPPELVAMGAALVFLGGVALAGVMAR